MTTAAAAAAEPTLSPSSVQSSLQDGSNKGRKWFLFLFIIVFALPVLVSWLFYTAVLCSNPVRTLLSLRRVQQQPHHPSASSSSVNNTYVMDYYSDYKIDQLRRHGLRNIHELEDSFIEIWFPAPLAWLARHVKRLFIPAHVHAGDESTTHSSSSSSRSKQQDSSMHHCSTVTLNTGEAVYFGRNFDWDHDATLILRVHDGKKNNNNKGISDHDNNDDLASIAVIDLHYLNLNHPHVEDTPLWQRIPLLFAPYYVMDGMNRHGVAIADMTVPEPAHPPQYNDNSGAAAAEEEEPNNNKNDRHHHHTRKPDIIHSSLARIILDYATTTAEAVNLMHEFQIHFPYADIHFMVADASGDSVVVEFIEGNIRVSSPSSSSSSTDDLSWHVSTNDIVWNKSEQEKDENCYRYEKGSGLAEQLLSDVSSHNKSINEKDAMHITRSMTEDGWTMWTSIYELKRREYWHFYKTEPAVVYQDTIKSRET